MPLPTPDGPTTISGLYFKGVGLKGWKYSFANTKTSFYIHSIKYKIFNDFYNLLVCVKVLMRQNRSKLL